MVNLQLALITGFIAASGTLGLMLSSETNPIMFIPGLGIPVGYYRHLKGMPPAGRNVVGGLSIAALLVLAFDAFLMTGDFFLAVAHMTIAFQAIKSFDLREPWDYLQVYFMALVQLVITSELSSSIAVGAVFAVFLVALIIAIAMAHFSSEGSIGRVKLKRPIALISLAAVIFTVFFFVAIPRPGAGYSWRKSHGGIKSVGFSEKVDFGSFGEVLQNQTVVMRAEVSGLKQPLYFRGGALDYFDGVSWKNTSKKRTPVYRTENVFVLNPSFKTGGTSGGSGSGPLTVQKLYVEPMDTDVLFGLGEVVAVESQGRFIETDPEGALFAPFKKNRRAAYTAYSVPSGGAPVTERDGYLQTPPGTDGIAALARKVTAGAKTAIEKASAIEGFLKSNYTYSLSTSPPPKGMTPIEDFLFKSKKGYCEHYATAMVLMLRSVGVPSRIVTGFSGGETNDYGDYVIVRESNAHSWVEAAVLGKWVRFDPTPPSRVEAPAAFFMYLDSLRMNWYRYVIGFSSSDQISLARYFIAPFEKVAKGTDGNSNGLAGFKVNVNRRLILYFAAFLSFAAIAVFIIVRLSSGRNSPETRAYLKFRARIKKLGGDVGPHSTPKDVLKEATRLVMDGSAVTDGSAVMDGSATEFIRLYEAARFGGIKLDKEERRRYQRLSAFK